MNKQKDERVGKMRSTNADGNQKKQNLTDLMFIPGTNGGKAAQMKRENERNRNHDLVPGHDRKRRQIKNVVKGTKKSAMLGCH
jgi:hypothetical protein